MKKRYLSFALALVLVCSLVFPAYAAERSGNGYHIRDIYFNGKKYEASLAASFKPEVGAACTIISSQAYVSFEQKQVTAVFNTKNYGHVFSSNNDTQTNVFSAGKTSFESPYAFCSKGASQVVSCLDINGSATVHGDGDYTLSAHLINR